MSKFDTVIKGLSALRPEERRTPFVSTVEIVCGSLIILGPLTTLVAIPLIINVCVALISGATLFVFD